MKNILNVVNKKIDTNLKNPQEQDLSLPKMFYGLGEVNLATSNNIIGMEIHYKSKKNTIIQKTLSKNWKLLHSKNKIIIFTLTKNAPLALHKKLGSQDKDIKLGNGVYDTIESVPSHYTLFKYSGYFELTKATVIGYDMNPVVLTIDNKLIFSNSLDLYKSFKGSYSTTNEKYSNLNIGNSYNKSTSSPKNDNKLLKDIIKRNDK